MKLMFIDWLNYDCKRSDFKWLELKKVTQKKKL